MVSGIPTSYPTYEESIVTFEKPDPSTPDCVGPDEFPELSEYPIRTRLIIEYMTFTDTDGQAKTLYAAIPSHIDIEIAYCELVFKDVGINIQVTQVLFEEYKMGPGRFFLDAKKYPDTMSVYYMLPQPFLYDGVASAPWEDMRWGILLSGSRDPWTLAHEVGHYFGLLHTFDEDYCWDTPKQDKWCEAAESPNCCNIMNYCSHMPKFLSENQKDRALRFLRAKRQNHVIMNNDVRRRDLTSLYNQLIQMTRNNEENFNAKTLDDKTRERSGDDHQRGSGLLSPNP